MKISGIRIRASLFRTRSRRLYEINKERARVLIAGRVAHFAARYEHCSVAAGGRIAIRNQKSRWGSCSKRGNLNFNYKLAFLPPELRDYVIVHELCHIKEFNHGKAFWALVAHAMPEYKDLRKRLRKVR